MYVSECALDPTPVHTIGMVARRFVAAMSKGEAEGQLYFRAAHPLARMHASSRWQLFVLYLGLARSRGVAVGLGTSGGTVGLGLNRGRGEVGERGLAHSSKTLASGGLTTALVGGQVERDEEDKVRAKDGNTRDSSELLTRAFTGVGHPGPVC
jgi:hypothetical protein